MNVGEFFNPYRVFVGSFIPNALMRYEGVSSTAKLVWARLAQYAGKDGNCYPAQETLAEEVGISTREAQRVIKALATDGFIEVKQPVGQDRLAHKTVRYKFLWHRIFEEGLVVSAHVADVVSAPVADVVSEVRDSDVRESEVQTSTEIPGQGLEDDIRRRKRCSAKIKTQLTEEAMRLYGTDYPVANWLTVFVYPADSVLTAEDVLEAIYMTGRKGVKSANYTNTILQGWHEAGGRPVAESVQAGNCGERDDWLERW